MTDKDLGAAAGDIFAKAFTLGYETGRKYVPPGGMALTAEQVEDVRRLLDELTSERDECDTWDLYERLRALFPATEPAEDSVGDPLQAWKDFLKPKPIGWYRTMELDFAAKHFGFPSNPVFEDRYTAPDGGKWQWMDELQWELREYPPAPAEPAEEETKAERGPEWFREIADAVDEIEKIPGMYHSMTLRSWAGVFRNHADTLELASSPVAPAATETGPQTLEGPWDRIEDIPKTVGRVTDRDGDAWEWDGDNWVTPETAILPTTYINRKYAPFVAAEEG